MKIKMLMASRIGKRVTGPQDVELGDIVTGMQGGALIVLYHNPRVNTVFTPLMSPESDSRLAQPVVYRTTGPTKSGWQRFMGDSILVIADPANFMGWKYVNIYGVEKVVEQIN